MNKYPLPLSSRIGMRWASKRNLRDDLKTAGVIVALVACYGIAGAIDYQEELRAEASAQTARAQSAEKLVADCMSGQAAFINQDQTIMVACSKAWETKL